MLSFGKQHDALSKLDLMSLLLCVMVLNPTENFSKITGTDIYFFSDVPHLIKTTRNAWANSTEKGTWNLMIST